MNIPRVTYCSPEVASVGLTEAQAVERGHEVVIEKLDFRAIGKANILAEGGVVKLVAQADGGPVLGVHMIGPHVTDLIAEAMLIANWEAVPAEVAALIHPHPSLSEAVGEAHLALAGKPLHTAVAKESTWRRRPTTKPAPGRRVRSPTTGCRSCCTCSSSCRYFDERMEALYRQGRLPGAIYSGRGQEGTHVGAAFALGPDDSLFPTHRDLSAQLTKGLDLKRVMAQFWGRIDGYTRGRDGNSHIGDWDGNGRSP